MVQNLILVGYLIYLPIVIVLTLLVAKVLFKNGKVFMLDIFNGREEIAHSTNRLFEVGFYLLNIGFALRILQINSYHIGEETGLIDLTVELSEKIGGFSIYLGIALFFNLFLFFRGKRIAAQKRNTAQTLR
jgi:hypothetical protein